MRNICILKTPVILYKRDRCPVCKQGVCAEKGRKCVMLMNVIFLSIKNYMTIDRCFYDMWWLLKKPFF